MSYLKRAIFFLIILFFTVLGLSFPGQTQATGRYIAVNYGSGIYGGGAYNTGQPTPTPANAVQAVSNTVSNAASSVRLAISSWTCTAQAPRSAPDLFEIDIKGTQAIIYFAPAARPYTNYYVSFGDGLESEGYGAGFQLSQTTGALKYDVYYLKPNMNYTFKVRAGNDCKAGPWSSTMTIKTGGKTSKTLAKFYPKKQAVNTYVPPTVLQLAVNKVTSSVQQYMAPPPPAPQADSASSARNSAPTQAPAAPKNQEQGQSASKAQASSPKPTPPQKTCFLFFCW